jgi:hypothetical protein
LDAEEASISLTGMVAGTVPFFTGLDSAIIPVD